MTHDECIVEVNDDADLPFGVEKACLFVVAHFGSGPAALAGLTSALGRVLCEAPEESRGELLREVVGCLMADVRRGLH